jgi:simple sugar transport system ATP-binding protein
MTDTIAVSVDNVSKRYGVTTALDAVSVTIRAGEVHGLIGRNGAGKSTLIRAITGLEAPDAGEIRYFGDRAPAAGSTEQWRSLVGTVQQRAPMIDHLSVAENIFLNRYPRGAAGGISWKRMMDEADELLTEWHIDANPRQLVGEVSVEARGLIQIARVLSLGSRVVLLDEPTVQLDRNATRRLFDHVLEMRERGVTFVFVSHFLDEIAQLCDSATVLRDGRVLWSRPTSEIGREDLVEAVLAGAQQGSTRLASRADKGAPAVLQVAGLGDKADTFRNVGFEVHAGELVAIAGLAGSGKNELGETIVGERRRSTGDVRVSGSVVDTRSVRGAQKSGIAFVPPDRHRSGYVPQLDVAENMTMSIPGRLGRGGFVSPRRRRELGKTLIESVTLVPPRPELLVSGLSGGNQQKVVFARATALEPSVLLLSSPTAGVDIAAKDIIYALIREALDRGVAVVMISDDLDEIQIASRVLVMVKGEIVAELHDPAESQVVRAMEGMEQEA